MKVGLLIGAAIAGLPIVALLAYVELERFRDRRRRRRRGGDVDLTGRRWP